jgi:UDP-N-acetylmuramate: L-alanyl-gamma-D-glutamyl-meso-diaminopimelate ligase
MNKATCSFVYFNPHAIAMKKLEPLSKEYVAEAFESTNLTVHNSSCELFSDIIDRGFSKPVFLFMSSGDFDGLNLSLVLS